MLPTPPEYPHILAMPLPFHIKYTKLQTRTQKPRCHFNQSAIILSYDLEWKMNSRLTLKWPLSVSCLTFVLLFFTAKLGLFGGSTSETG